MNCEYGTITNLSTRSLKAYLVWGMCAIKTNVLIGLTQQKPKKGNMSDLLYRNGCILVPTREQEGNQYGNSGTDHLRRVSETVQDRGCLSGISVSSTFSKRLRLS